MTDVGPSPNKVFRVLVNFQWACFAASFILSVAALYVGGKDGLVVVQLTAPGFLAFGGFVKWVEGKNGGQ